MVEDPLVESAANLFAIWPGFRAWAGPLPLGLSPLGPILIPLSTPTGETLERHTALADGLLPSIIGLFAFSLLGYAL